MWDWWTRSWVICSYWPKILAVKGFAFQILTCVQCVLVFCTSAPVIVSSRKVQCWNWVWEFGECNSDLPWNPWKWCLHNFSISISQSLDQDTCYQRSHVTNTDMCTVKYYHVNSHVHWTSHCPIFELLFQISYLVSTTYVSNAHYSHRKVVTQECRAINLCQDMYIWWFSNYNSENKNLWTWNRDSFIPRPSHHLFLIASIKQKWKEKG